MTSMTEIFIEKINKEIEKTKDTDLGYGVVDIWSLYRCLALDVIGETAFGQSFDMIENNSHFIPPAITEEIKAAAINTMIPSYIKFFMKGMSTLDPCIDTVS
jgi:hypothetical protein